MMLLSSFIFILKTIVGSVVSPVFLAIYFANPQQSA